MIGLVQDRVQNTPHCPTPFSSTRGAGRRDLPDPPQPRCGLRPGAPSAVDQGRPQPCEHLRERHGHRGAPRSRVFPRAGFAAGGGDGGSRPDVPRPVGGERGGCPCELVGRGPQPPFAGAARRQERALPHPSSGRGRWGKGCHYGHRRASSPRLFRARRPGHCQRGVVDSTLQPCAKGLACEDEWRGG